MHQFSSKYALDETLVTADTHLVTSRAVSPIPTPLPPVSAQNLIAGRFRVTVDNDRLRLVAVIAAAVGFGLGPYLASRTLDSGISPLGASSIRLAVMAVVMSPAAYQLKGWGRESVLVAGAGAASGAGITGFYAALNQAPIAAVTVVYYTYPVVVVVLAALIGKRRLLKWEVASGVGVLAGVVLAVGPVSLSIGLLLSLAPAFAAPLGWSVLLLVLCGPAASMPTRPKVFAAACGGAAVLLPLAMWQTDAKLMPATSDAVISIGLLSVVGLAIPSLLMTWGASRTSEQTTAIVGSFEFVVAVAAGWLLLGGGLKPTQIIGVLLVLGAVTWSAAPQSRNLPVSNN